MKGFLTLACFIIAIFTAPRAESAMIQWETLSPKTTTLSPIQDIAFGNGTVVAIGGYEVIYSKNDGSTWHTALRSSSVQFTAVKFGNGKFVVLGTNKSFTSRDGATWSEHGFPYSTRSILYGNGLFVAGGPSGGVATSADGETWNTMQVTAAGDLYQGAFGNGRFIFKEPYASELPFPGPPPEYPRFLTWSTDGVTWTRSVIHFPDDCITSICNLHANFYGLVFANGAFYAHSYGRYGALGYISSTNGITWTQVAPEASVAGTGLFYEGGRFIEMQQNNSAARKTPAILSSTDFVNWRTDPFELELPPASTVGPITIVFTGSTYIVGGFEGLVERGPTVDALERIDSPEKYADISGMAGHGDTVVAVGARMHGSFVGSTSISVSTNGAKSFVRKSSSGPSLSAVRYGDGKFIAVGDGLAVLRSVDGLEWTTLLSGGVWTLMDAAYANGFWLTVGTQGSLMSSDDGDALFFDRRTSGTTADLYGIAYGNGTWVVVGSSGTVLTSADTKTWNVTTIPDAGLLLAVAFGNGTFVAAGDAGRVYTSANGVDWTPGAITGAAFLPRVAFAHGLFVSVDFRTRATFSSPDGKHWTQLDLPEGSYNNGVDTIDGKLFVYGSPAQIYREQAAPITVIAGLNQSRQFTLSFEPPTDGSYRVESTTDPATDSWSTATTLIVSSGPVTWTETDMAMVARFYRLVQE